MGRPFSITDDDIAVSVSEYIGSHSDTTNSTSDPRTTSER